MHITVNVTFTIKVVPKKTKAELVAHNLYT